MHPLFQHRLSLTDFIPEGYAIADCNIAWADELVMCTFAEEDWDEYRCVKPCRVRILRLNEHGLLQTLDLQHALGPLYQGLSHGRFLQVYTRAEKREECNAFILDADGQVEGRFQVGDAVKDVQITDEDAVWVSYFDEGALRNKIWGRWDGLAEFDLQGNIRWQYNGCMMDCYALNVGKTEVHACYYTDFPVLRVSLKNKSKRLWQNKFRRGCSALAVWGDHVLLAGGYAEQAHLASLVRLEEDSTSLVSEFSLELPGKSSWLTGRGPKLHYINGENWWVLDVRDLL